MEKIFLTGLLILLFSINVSGEFSTERKLIDKSFENDNTTENEPIRGSPTDKGNMLIEVADKANSVKVNGKIVETVTDTLDNKINVEGTGNTVVIEQQKHSSKIIVTQKGTKNQISIIQK